jgi:hypothetical protein
MEAMEDRTAMREAMEVMAADTDVAGTAAAAMDVAAEVVADTSYNPARVSSAM